MRRIYVSTVGRGKALEEASRIYCIDYDTGETLASRSIPLSMHDLSAKNPRGGTRGARGMCFWRTKLWVAGWDGLFEVDPEDLFIEHGYWSKDCQDIHQIYADQYKMDVIGTKHNSVYEFNPDYRHNPIFRKTKDLTKLHTGVIQIGNTDTLHFNAMYRPYANFSSVGAICNIQTKKIMIQDERLLHSHDLVLLPNGELVTNISPKRQTITIDTESWQIKRTLIELPEVKQPQGSKLCMPGWMRGMSYIENYDTLLLGSAPAKILAIEGVCSSIPTNTYKEISISEDIVESVFDVIPHPGDWQ